MTEQEFNNRLSEIERQYAGSRVELEAKRDQEVGRLFVECGWTQKRIAERMGWSQPKVSLRLVFGRFLNYYGRNNSKLPTDSLNEWHFREAWKRSGKGGPKDSEDDRFERVAKLLASTPPSDPPKGYQNLVKKPGITKAVVEVLKAGTRLDVAQIAEAVGDKFPDLTHSQVSAALSKLQTKPPKGFAMDARHSGRTHKYRLIARSRPTATPMTVTLEEAESVLARALPLVAECIDILKKPEVGRQTTLALEHLWRVQQMLKRLSQEQAVV
jgi:hypothetical protein